MKINQLNKLIGVKNDLIKIDNNYEYSPIKKKTIKKKAI